MNNPINAPTNNPMSTSPEHSNFTTTANMNPYATSTESTPNNDDGNINSPISPNPSEDNDIDENFIANFDPNAPLTLETQYQLAQDDEKPLPPPVSERGVPRAVTILLLTGGILLLGLLIWQFIKPKSPREPIAQSTPKESSSGTIKDEKPELLAKLAYLDQQKLLAEKPQKTAKPKTEPSPKPSRAPRTPRTPRLVATRSAAPPPTPLREPLPAPRTVVRTVTVPAPIPQRTPAPPPAPIPKPLIPPPLIPTPTSEKIDPFERWNQLAQLGQIRGNFDPNRIANAVSATPSTPATTSATAADR